MTPDLSVPALSWNTHAILTRVALSTADVPRLADEVPVVPLAEFLGETTDDLPLVVKWYWKLSAEKARTQAPLHELPQRIGTDDEFTAAMRLNPDRPILYVRALRTDELPAGTTHDQSRNGPPGEIYRETRFGEEMSALEILAAFSDEPDWGMDQDLFPIESYRYGSAPFGGAVGLSSQAPFHMAFFHEKRLVTALLPRLRKSFVEERIRLALALARLALSKGIDYWAWRFASWAVHYLQDLTQPYHARPFPPSIVPILKRFLRRPNPRRFMERHRGYLRNRHILFEAFVHYELNRAVKEGVEHPWLQALAGDGEAFHARLVPVMKASTKAAAALARKIDRAMTALLDDPRIDEPGFALEEHAEYRVQEVLAAAAAKRPELYGEIIRLVAECFTETGRVTRFVVRRILMMS